MPSYSEIADEIAADIREARLKPGDRLPPQRDFAYERGIATSTAARVYAELIRRGLASGEVGRGTFVRLAASPGRPELTEPTALQIDLELNFPRVPEQDAWLTASLAQLMERGRDWQSSFEPTSARGTSSLRGLTAAFLSRSGFQIDPECLLFSGNGKQAIAATMAAALEPGDRLGVEALTYPFVKNFAQQLGVRLVPLPMDKEGIAPNAIIDANRTTPLKAVYLQPTLHNPLGATLSERRRGQLAAELTSTGILAIEDAVYAFLDTAASPLRAMLPQQVVLIDSLSKRLTPGMTLGFILPPAHLQDRIARALHRGAWTAPAFAQNVCARWMADGTAARIIEAKREAAATRQEIAGRWLGRFDLVSDPKAFHCWLRLPDPWRADTFVAAAARRNIAISPASAYSVVPGHVANAVRIALSAPPLPVLSEALRELVRILEKPDEALYAQQVKVPGSRSAA